MADSSLDAIVTKVRRLTRSPSAQQLTDNDIYEYVNTFILYDFPQELSLSTLRKRLRFYTEPNVDVYETSAVGTDPLYNFKNIYTNIYSPIYISGYQVSLSKSEQEFYSAYPYTNTVATEGTGNGANDTFNGTLSHIPVLRNNVLFTSVSIAGNPQTLADDGNGNLTGDGNGTINYTTGVYTTTFTVDVIAGGLVESHTVPYVANRPDTVMFFDNKFTLRPVPDKIYPVVVEVDMRPTELLAGGTSPELEAWWQYIALAASRAIFVDRSDTESITDIMPELKRQELLVLRRALKNMSQDRSSTIYVTSLGNNNSRYRRRW